MLQYSIYVNNPPLNECSVKKNWMPFILLYHSFVNIYKNKIKCHDLFIWWNLKDIVGEYPSNMKLLLLTFLCYIEREWNMYNVEEANGISREVNWGLIYTFLEYGSTIQYKKWVTCPSIIIDTGNQETLFRMPDFNGYIGSFNATYVPILKCSTWSHVMHNSFKLKFPTRTYNTKLDHCPKILCSTIGHPSTWNGKNLAFVLSTFIKGILWTYT